MLDYVKKSVSIVQRRTFLIILSLIQSIIVARTLGPEGFGIAIMIMLIPGYMEKFGRLGLGSAATYMISSGKLKVEDTAKILMFFSLSVGFLPLLLLPVYYQHFLSYFLDNKNVAMLTVAFLLLSMPGVFINNYFSNVMISYEDVKSVNSIAVISKVINFAVTVSLLLLTDLNYVAVFAGSFAFNVSSALIALHYYRKYTGTLPLPGFNKEIFKTLWGYSKKIYLSMNVAYMHSNLVTLFLAFYLSSKEVAFFCIAVAVLEKFLIIPKSLSTLMIPKVAKASDAYSSELTARAFRNTLLILFVFIVCVAIAAKSLVKIVYGSEYLSAVEPLQIMALGYLMMGASRLLASYFNGRGRPEINLYISLVSLLINIILNILLIPVYGIIGASISVLATYWLVAIIQIVLFIRFSNMRLFDVLLINRGDINGYRKLLNSYIPRFAK
jgi:O-antigen/teichoic acid export membrane protein